jgi:hypothetical protein
MDMRRVRVGCEFVYVAAVDTSAVFQVEPLGAAPVSLARREWSTEPEVRIRHYTDLYGNPCTRVMLPAGRQAEPLPRGGRLRGPPGRPAPSGASRRRDRLRQ